MKSIKTLVGISLAVSLFAPSFSFAETSTGGQAFGNTPVVVSATGGTTTNVADLQAQLQALLKQVAALQAQIKAAQTGQGYCHYFEKNLRVGDQGDEVKNLQSALKKEGLDIPDNEVQNGQYGEGTAAAVSGFQQKYNSDILAPNGLKFGTGYTGASTRSRLNRIYSCGGTLLPVPSPALLHISGISPDSGPVGAQVTLKGYGFTATDNTVNFGSGAITGLSAQFPATDMSANSQSDLRVGYSIITFAVPDAISPACLSLNPPCAIMTKITAPDTYAVSVTNSNGTSNAVKFTVTGNGTTTGAPTISGVSGPTTLKVGKQGIWTVKASDPNNGTLSYSVLWGDEAQYAYGMNAPTASAVQQAATFTHAYNTAGTYSPKFTVSNSTGSAQTSLSVAVINQTSPVSYRNAYWQCYDGTESHSGDSTSCKTSETWQKYAQDFCANRCSSNSGTTKCGVNSFSVSNECGATITQPSISSLTPTSGQVGTSVYINGKGFTPTNNTVNFGSGAITGLPSATWISDSFTIGGSGTTNTGQTITFKVPDSLTPACYYSTPRCLIATMLTQPGVYAVSVTNANGTSDQTSFTVLAPGTADLSVQLNSMTAMLQGMLNWLRGR